jgi:hypothetical protein
MSEPMRNLTPADLREDAVRIIDAAKGLIEFCDLYGDVYADDLHEEIVLAFEYISAAAKGAAKRQQALHERASKFADSVFADLERLPVQGDLLADPPDFDSVWPEAHDLVLPDDYRADHPFPLNIDDTDEEAF